MNTHLSIFHKSNETEPKHLANLKDETFGIYVEPCFRELLILERKRSERSGSSFVLLLIDIQSLSARGQRKNKNTALKQVLSTSVRETDIVGWFEQGRVIGVVCMEASAASAESIVEKFRTGMMRYLEADDAAGVRISWFSFPEKTNEEAPTEVVGTMYPNPAASVATGKVSVVAKRAVDIVGSLFGIALFSPFFIAIPILIRATSKGPVFFRQTRVGLGGKTFKIFKFRTMHVNCDSKIHKDFVSQFIKGSAAPQSAPQGEVFKITNDPRITAIGRFLRKTSLDEIPQFFNVLTGEMSLVGPRPAIPYEVGEYEAWHKRRVFEVKPGITGIWQVEGRSLTTFEGMVRMDIQYIRRCSVLLDLKLIFKTPLALFSAKGAY